MRDHKRNPLWVGTVLFITALYMLISYNFIMYAASFTPVAGVLIAVWQLLFYGIVVNLVLRPAGRDDQ